MYILLYILYVKIYFFQEFRLSSIAFFKYKRDYVYQWNSIDEFSLEILLISFYMSSLHFSKLCVFQAISQNHERKYV